MTILGIDPGYAIVGWGVLEYSGSRFCVKGYGAITTPAGMDFPRRLEDDTADALALAICHAHCAGSGLDYQTRYQQQLRRTIHDLQP